MANYTAYYRTSTGLNLYAKPYPLTNPWGTDAISLTPGIGGEYSFTADSTKEYVIFVRAGGSPAATDLDEVTIPKNTQITIDATLVEVTKIPRRASPIAAGAAVTKTNTSESPNEVITEVLS